MLLEGCGEDSLAVVKNLGGEAVVNVVRRQRGDAAVVVFVVVPLEEALAMGAGIFERAEAIRELRPVLQGFELAFRERVVIGDRGPAVGLGDAEIGSFKARALLVIEGPLSAWRWS